MPVEMADPVAPSRFRIKSVDGRLPEPLLWFRSRRWRPTWIFPVSCP